MKRILCFAAALVLMAGLGTQTLAAEAETTAPGASPSQAPTQPEESSAPSEPSVPSEPSTPSEPSAPSEPSVPSEPSAPPEPSVPQFPTMLEIDTEHIYEGMEEPYEDGYAPKTENGVVSLVLPLIPTGEIYGGKIKASLSLGSGSPFVMTTYEKTFSLEKVTPEGSSVPVELFLVRFDVALTKDRTNGVYPVTVNISGYDAKGASVSGSYTLYVTVTDGKSGTPAQSTPETPTAEPVVYISKTVVSPEKAMAGEEFTLTVTLQNSLSSKSVKNMLVTVNTGNSRLNLLEDSNVIPVEKIAAGGTAALTIRLKADASLPAGKYPVSFSFQYDSSKTLNLSSSGAATVEIRQPANMELVMPRFPADVTVGETVPLSLQVMNMGRDPMYNVRCVVSGFGFAPSNTGYIGTMEAGSSDTTKVELYIIALNASKGNENGSQYGTTTGTVTLIYENESGEEFQEETQFETNVMRAIAQLPQKDNTEEEAEKAAGAWWISIVILGGVILAGAVIGLLIHKKSKNRGGNYL